MAQEQLVRVRRRGIHLLAEKLVGNIELGLSRQNLLGVDGVEFEVKPGGGVLWYDFTFDNPRNPDVRGVPLSRVRTLFPHATLRVRRVTLAPPLARAVTRVHPALYGWFNALPWLRTHVLCWLAKAGPPGLSR